MTEQLVYLDGERAIGDVLAAEFDVQVVVARVLEGVEDVEEAVLFDHLQVDVPV